MKSKSRFLGIDDAPFRFSDERVPLVGVVVQAPAYIEGVLTTLAEMERALRRRFDDWDERWDVIRRHDVESVRARHGSLWVTYAGTTASEVREAVGLTTVRGVVPEPLRVAHLIAAGIMRGESRGRACRPASCPCAARRHLGPSWVWRKPPTTRMYRSRSSHIGRCELRGKITSLEPGIPRRMLRSTLIVRVVERLASFESVDRPPSIRRHRRYEAPKLGVRERHTRQAARDDEAPEVPGVFNRVREREHSPVAVPQEMDPPQMESASDPVGLFDGSFDREERRPLRPVRLPAAQLVVQDHAVAEPGEIRKAGEVAVRDPGAAVQAQDRTPFRSAERLVEKPESEDSHASARGCFRRREGHPSAMQSTGL